MIYVIVFFVIIRIKGRENLMFCETYCSLSPFLLFVRCQRWHWKNYGEKREKKNHQGQYVYSQCLRPKASFLFRSSVTVDVREFTLSYLEIFSTCVSESRIISCKREINDVSDIYLKMIWFRFATFINTMGFTSVF